MVTIQFTPELSALQGVIISADYECSFRNLSAKGGNEKKIDLVIGTIKNFLKSKKYLNDKGCLKDAVGTMRQFALYIVLNSDLEVLNELVNTDSTIDLVIWTVPTIPKCLMCEMLWNLCMEKFVKEIISYSYPRLAIEVADALILNVKYMNPTECLKQLHVLTTGCFNILCRLHFFDFEENILKSGSSNFQRCMAYFCNPPNESKLEKLQKDDLYRYYGNCLYTMLSILVECFTQYNANLTCNIEDPSLYEVTYSTKCVKKTGYKPCECTDKNIVEILNNCLTDLLDKTMKLVMGINLDIFCSWSEFHEGCVTMQESVGQLSYKVREKLLASNFSDHSVVSMLEQISRKPVDIKDVINTTTDSLVISEKVMQNDNESIQWLHSLLHRDNVSEDLVLLQVLDSNVDRLDEAKAHEFFQKLHSNFDNIPTENKQIIKNLVIKLFQSCNNAVRHDIVDNNFKNDKFNNDMECSEFVCMLTEFFNKQAITPDSDVSDILNVFLQNPRQTYVTIFKTAIENKQQTDLMFRVLSYLSKYSNHYYIEETEPCLTVVLKNTLEQELTTDVKQDNFTNFINKLKNANILSSSKLLLLIIMPQLHNGLMNKNYRNIHLQCKLLNKCYSVEDLLQYRTPMLAMLAQVMGQVRWKINTFDNLGPSILDLVIDLQMSLMNSYDGTIPENEASWLKRKLKELDPLNMYYYRQLWNPPGNTFVEVVSGIHIHVNMDIELLTLWLAQVLSSSTLQEWECIWGNLKEFGEAKILDLFHNAMMTVLKAEKNYRTNTTWSCLLYCYKNLFHCMRYMFFTEPLSSCQVSNVTNKLIATTCCIPEEDSEEFGQVITPLFAYIAERKEDYNLNISEILERLPQNKLSAMIIHFFRNTILT